MPGRRDLANACARPTSRVAIRGDDEHELEQRAAALVRETQIQAIVVSPADLLGTGPARLLTSFETGPATIEVHDWTADLHALIERSISEPLGEFPKLIVPGELVLQRYRPASRRAPQAPARGAGRGTSGPTAGGGPAHGGLHRTHSGGGDRSRSRTEPAKKASTGR